MSLGVLGSSTSLAYSNTGLANITFNFFNFKYLTFAKKALIFRNYSSVNFTKA
jgi:hypothetical protein